MSKCVHHWMFNPQGSEHPLCAKCKYCGEERTFSHPNPYETNRIALRPSPPEVEK